METMEQEALAAEVVEKKRGYGFKTKMEFSNEEKAEIFLDLEDKSYEEVALAHGLDEFYKTIETRKNRISRIYKEVSKKPEKYGLTFEQAERVMRGKISRSGEELKPMVFDDKGKEDVALEMPASMNTEIKDDMDIKGMVIAVRNKALKLVMKKLNAVDAGDINSMNLVQLTTAFGTIFDKGQIVMGEATENIAVLAKIDRNMKPQDALKAILQMRETNQEAKEKKK